ncbi:hypothetical protein F3Y22_tig00110718pilonHSYRG00086 [Hibiscus syriacus]|uniref:Uncharacterized protein n=1 Tax=Hibiscus syriacus TaxID=106335 RepID=A0A6A2ZTP9_HIBSY|nr:hypothetical protein F3Y22_tig00110718pilonHSYRG00086 [Hibiscus syriacus]
MGSNRPWLLGGGFNAILNIDECRETTVHVVKGSFHQHLDRCLVNEGSGVGYSQGMISTPVLLFRTYQRGDNTIVQMIGHLLRFWVILFFQILFSLQFTFPPVTIVFRDVSRFLPLILCTHIFRSCFWFSVAGTRRRLCYLLDFLLARYLGSFLLYSPESGIAVMSESIALKSKDYFTKLVLSWISFVVKLKSNLEMNVSGGHDSLHREVETVDDPFIVKLSLELDILRRELKYNLKMNVASSPISFTVKLKLALNKTEKPLCRELSLELNIIHREVEIQACIVSSPISFIVKLKLALNEIGKPLHLKIVDGPFIVKLSLDLNILRREVEIQACIISSPISFTVKLKLAPNEIGKPLRHESLLRVPYAISSKGTQQVEDALAKPIGVNYCRDPIGPDNRICLGNTFFRKH